MSTPSPLSPRARKAVISADRWIYRLSRHWMLAFSISYGAFVALPFVAPLFMQLGWIAPARGLYAFYSTLCHQLPERSFFLFGAKPMYSLPEIQQVWQNTFDPLILRRFIGTPALGWKVAWSDRMVSMYTSVLIFGWLWWPVRKRLKPLPLWGLALLALPMAVDGSTHLLSDLAGIGQGFRYDNAWLASLTGHVFPPSFYVGDALGSFNSWMRLISGVLFGLGIVWFAFPFIQQWCEDTARLIEARFAHAGEPLRPGFAKSKS